MHLARQKGAKEARGEVAGLTQRKVHKSVGPRCHEFKLWFGKNK